MPDTIWVVERIDRKHVIGAGTNVGAATINALHNYAPFSLNDERAFCEWDESADDDADHFEHNGYMLRRITLPTDAERHLVEAGLRYVSAKRAYHNLANGASDEPQFGTLGDADDAISEAADAVRAERAATTRVSVASSASVQSGGKWVPIPDMGPTRNNATWQATAENDGTERAATSPGDAPRATGA